MFAVPFQAYAAAAMVFCGPGHESAVAAAAVQGDGHADHRHHHEAAAQDAKQPAHDSADASAHAGPDSMHKCSTCGTCGACHATALTSMELPVFQGLPGADLAEPAAHVATAVPRLLDKPPRA